MWIRLEEAHNEIDSGLKQNPHSILGGIRSGVLEVEGEEISLLQPNPTAPVLSVVQLFHTDNKRHKCLTIIIKKAL